MYVVFLSIANLPLRQISWWMLDLYFGLDASGFDKSGTHTLEDLIQQGP